MSKKKRKKTLYEELEVSPLATKEEIKKAYRKKSRKVHPDVNKSPDAEQEFKDLTKAYMILYDDQARWKYDQFGEEEKPSDRKPINIDELSEQFMIKVIFGLVDKLGDSSDKYNFNTQLRKAIQNCLSDVVNRLALNKKMWKAQKGKFNAVINKKKTIKEKSVLDKMLDLKLQHIKTQELIPTYMQHKQLITDKKVMLKCLSIIDTECIDSYVEEVVMNPMSDWDRQMAWGNMMGTTTSMF